MGQWPDPKPHSSTRKEKGAACVRVGCSVIVQPQYYCLLINWNALVQKIGYPPLMKAVAS